VTRAARRGDKDFGQRAERRGEEEEGIFLTATFNSGWRRGRRRANFGRRGRANRRKSLRKWGDPLLPPLLAARVLEGSGRL